MFVRNQLVYNATKRRIAEIHAANLQDIDAGIKPPDRYGELESHGAMLFDLRCWTYKQFFPNPLTREEV